MHCNLCRCRTCDFCATSVCNGTGSRADWYVGSGWCDTMLRRPSSLLRRMWAMEAWGSMKRGVPACWEMQRDRPSVRLASPNDFFRAAERGDFCASNWYEGHPGSLGRVGQPPEYPATLAPALLGFDEGIHAFCSAELAPAERAMYVTGRDGKLKRGAVARACVAASKNILNMVGSHVPYNLCLNLEWQARRYYYTTLPLYYY